MGAEHATELAVRQLREVRRRVRLLDAQALAPAERDHVAVEVDAARLDAGLAHQLEKLSPPAADIENRLPAAKVVDIGALALANLVGRSAHSRLEREVVGLVRRRGQGR